MSRENLREPGFVLPLVKEDSIVKANALFYTARGFEQTEIIAAINSDREINKASDLVQEQFGQMVFEAGKGRALAMIYLLEKEGFATFPTVGNKVASDFITEWKDFLQESDRLGKNEDRSRLLRLIEESFPIPKPEKYHHENPYLMDYFSQPQPMPTQLGSMLVYELKRRQAIENLRTT